jgi:hypothetical protein
MTTYTGTQTVKGGYYLNVAEWELKAIDGKGGTLPGGEQDRFVRVPLAALLVIAPVLGLIFVVLLPFLGLAVVVEQAWRKTMAVVETRRAARVTTVRR